MELDEFTMIGEEPYYRAIGDEVRLFTTAYAERMPIMLKGPTGCGKTRFVDAGHKLARQKSYRRLLLMLNDGEPSDVSPTAVISSRTRDAR
jgi:MoxR-like ATPase